MPLASVQKCLDLQPIPGADQIEVASVMGWKCVVKKGEFKVGDFGVFIEIDSIIPPRPEFEFLRSKHFMVRTIKLRKQISQGLFMPISILRQDDNWLVPVHTLTPCMSGVLTPEFELKQCLSNALHDNRPDLLEHAEGCDVTEYLGVQKYEKEIPAQLRATVRGNFPTQYVPKTDETRIQSCRGVLYEILNRPLYMTVKMDGCSATFIHKDGDTHVCSRNNSLQPDENNSFWKMDAKYKILEQLKAKGLNYAIQGELCGPGVQGNKMGLKELDLFVFNVFDTDKWQYLNYEDMIRFCESMGLKTVPMDLGGLIQWAQPPTIDELLELAKGTYENGYPREGIVIRTAEEMECRALHGRASFKVVNNDFLLKAGE